ncbi:MAG: Ldh family oxidoreductase [Chloroflexota bacterium]|jgi:L-2-hydroxycarboxylate dehydrogenase (NAD+)
MQSINAHTLTDFVARLLRAYRLSPTHAMVCASHIIGNDQRGIITHGIRRLPNYLARIDAGAINPRARIRVITRHKATTWLDGQHAMGQITATHATHTVIRLAQRYGVACVGAQRTEHIGALDAYVRTIVAHQLLGIVICNSPVAMAPLGGTQPLIGSNPIAIGIPGTHTPLIVFDGSTAATSRGKILAAAEAQKTIPPHVAVDAHGQPTQDANAALSGAILPAGALGYGLGLAIGMMTGGMIGGVHDAHLPSYFVVPHQPVPASVMMLAINPAMFGGIAQLSHIGDTWVNQIRQSHGTPRIPGDSRQLRDTITAPESVLTQLAQHATIKRIPLW